MHCIAALLGSEARHACVCAHSCTGQCVLEGGCDACVRPARCLIRREVDEREKDPAFVSDAYAECYPEYHGYNATIVDSDDEADYSHMDSKFGKGRTDFQTEEEWQVITCSVPAAPSAHSAQDSRKETARVVRQLPPRKPPPICL